MIDVVARSVIGYLSQVVPCAVLALVPFWESLAMPKKTVVIRVTVFVAALCAVFTAVNALPADPVPENFAFVMELTFYATLVVFFWQYLHVVDASFAKKVFVFLLAMAYGCACLMAYYVLGQFVVGDHHGDGRMYLWSTLPFTVTTGVVAFVPAYFLMRRVITPYLSLNLDKREWWGQCLIPASIVVFLVGGIWLPTQLGLSHDVKTSLLIIFVLVFTAVLMILVSKAYTRIHQDKLERAEDKTAVSAEQADEPKTGEAAKNLVTIGTPAALISFYVDEALYLEVFNHTLVVHLKDGREERANVSLSKATELLPEGRFIQCHRSYLVNLDEARSLVRYELTLSSGAKVPVSKQRYLEVRSELEGRGNSSSRAGEVVQAEG